MERKPPLLMADPRQKAAGVSGKKARHRVLARHAVRLYAILWMTLQNGTFKTHLTALVRHGPKSVCHDNKRARPRVQDTNLPSTS